MGLPPRPLSQGRDSAWETRCRISVDPRESSAESAVTLGRRVSRVTMRGRAMAERRVVFYECQDIENQPPFDRLKAVGGINDLDDEDWRVPDGDFDLGVIVDRQGSSTEATRLRLIRI